MQQESGFHFSGECLPLMLLRSDGHCCGLQDRRPECNWQSKTKKQHAQMGGCSLTSKDTVPSP